MGVDWVMIILMGAAGLLALICVVGMARNWNRPGPPMPKVSYSRLSEAVTQHPLGFLGLCLQVVALLFVVLSDRFPLHLPMPILWGLGLVFLAGSAMTLAAWPPARWRDLIPGNWYVHLTWLLAIGGLTAYYLIWIRPQEVSPKEFEAMIRAMPSAKANPQTPSPTLP